MKTLVSQFLIAAFCIGFASTAVAQNATLVIYNNTNATLDVYADQVYGSTTTSTVRVPPTTRMTFTDFLPRGNVRVVAEAPFVRPRVNSLNVSYVVSGATPRTREWEIFASSFGMSAMYDRPSLDVPTPDPPSDRVCRNLRAGDKYFDGWTRCCDTVPGRSDWTRRSDGAVIDYAGSCRSWEIY